MKANLMKPRGIIKSIVIWLAILVFVSCGISINDNSIYQDGEWANAQWLGQDVTTFFIALPLLLLSYLKSRREQSIEWNMVLCGILFYFVYTYTFYVMVAELTFLYLFHVPIFGLSIAALAILFSQIFQVDIQLSNRSLGIKIIVSLFFGFISLMLAYLWLSDIILHLISPNHVSDTPDGKPALIIYSLDLGLVIPLMITATIGIWKNKQYGLILTGVMLTKAATMGFALMGMSLSMYLQKINLDSFLIFLWSFIGVLGALITINYLRQIKLTEPL